MKNTLTIILLVVLGIFCIQGCSKYNSFVDYDENVAQAWSNVETQYQRRADLIPNLVNTVKGYAEFEKSTFVEVTQARSNATSIKLTSDDLTPENMAKFQQAQSQLSGSLSRLLATFERYPDLKANQGFLDLQKQLEGTENRIAVSRKDFNGIVTEYNKTIRKFPSSFYASVFGFDRRAAFEADAGAENAPKVEF
ncbi:MAG: LemA protein [Saprospiraceae bacterium]|jgi:LemA protein